MMINKIFKRILLLSLCIGMTLPTNAAVSVSDGSAFVTKAEFSADLNNLSNRMAQLENSLDAKIDSLVSSYLTRNGIWNGAKVTIVNDAKDAYAGIYGNANATGRLLFWGASSAWQAGGSSYKMLVPYTSSTTSATLVNPCEKSGLMFFNYRYQLARADISWGGSVTSTQMNVCVGTTNASSTVNGDWPNLLVGALFSINRGTEVLWSINQSILCPVPSLLSGFYVPNATGTFFVSKGDVLTWSITNLSKAGYVACYNGGAQNDVFRFQVLDAYIY